MMSKYIKITFIATVVCGLISIIAFSFADKQKLKKMNWVINIEKNLWNSDDDANYIDFDLMEEIAISPDDEFVVFTVAGNVEVLASKDNKARLHIKTKVKDGFNLGLDDFLKIDGNEKIIFLGYDEKKLSEKLNNKDKSFSVSYNLKDFAKFLADTKYAEITLELPLNIKSLNINAVNADVKVDGLSFEKTAVNVVSGDVDLSELKSPRVEINTVSGDISCKTCTVDKVEVNSVSGDVDFKIADDSTYRIDFSTMSGSFDGERRKNSKSEKTLEVNTVSGDLKIL